MNMQYSNSVDFAAINARCLAVFPSLLMNWLPTGRIEGRDWVALNPTRHDRQLGSFKIHMDKGCWADFATGDKGGDPVNLYAYLNGLSQVEAARALNGILGGVS